MATKLQVITQYAHQVVQSFSSRRGAWQTYLKTAAQVYKYPFRDQILIYAQRPDAIACASMELWNQKMGRWVNQGARGIALLDDTGQQTKLHYVFDVTDTHPGRYRSSEPQLWHMEPSHQRAIAASISQRFGVTYEENIPFAQQICTMSAQIVANHLNDYLNELHMVIPDSFLEELDDLNLSVHLKTLLTNSVAYTILTRCGIDAEDYFDHEDFAFIHDFSSYETISVLGNATTTISKMVLLEIGRTIQAQEQKFAKQQTLIYDGLTKQRHKEQERGINLMKTELTYTQKGDYLYPNLTLPQQPDYPPLGKYGMLHKTFLKQHKPMLYDRLLLAGKLDSHLMEIDQQATQLVEQLIQQMAVTQGVNEELKASHQMEWVQVMNNLKAAAEEVALHQLIYR